jgi:carotenoid phi-ring synthase / carotenoid chi-ring synthase
MIAGIIMRRLGGSRHQVNLVSPDLPLRLRARRTTAVIGAGIAGLSAAACLAERGFAVSLLEKNPYVGGKVGSWHTRLADGFEAWIDHGFHGFFRQYFNLRRMLDRFGASSRLVPVEDYLISTMAHGSFSFKGTARTPLLNMLSLSRTGLYRLGDMIRNPQSRRLLAFLSYNEEKTFAAFDDVSFQDFSNSIGLPTPMRIMFNTFSRSFFADPGLMSTAEVMKSFHYYFLSNNLGLLYDYLEGNYEETLLSPTRAHLERHGVKILTSQPVQRIERAGKGFRVAGREFDSVVLAADAGSARRIVESSPFIKEEAPVTAENFQRLASSRGYAVLRLWLDRPLRQKLPAFFSTDRVELLDSITLQHRIDGASSSWALENRGSVLELHSYALPAGMRDENDIQHKLVGEMKRYLPELREATAVHAHLQVRDDFTAFYTGMHRGRPGVTTGIPGLLLAGDWVETGLPAMLMEAACTSALLAANTLLTAEGVQEEPVFSVPRKGLFA